MCICKSSEDTSRTGIQIKKEKNQTTKNTISWVFLKFPEIEEKTLEI